MSQVNSFQILNQAGIDFRTAVNDVLGALASNHSGNDEPTDKKPLMIWADTSSGYMRQRNVANDGWVNLWPLDGSPLLSNHSIGDLSDVDLTGLNNGGIIQYDGSAFKAMDLSLSGTDQTARAVAIAAFIKADISNSDPSGVYGPVVADDFSLDSLATKTNAIYDLNSSLYKNQSVSMVGGNIGSNLGNMTSNGGLAGAFDGVTLQNENQGAYYANGSGWIGKDYGAGNEKEIVRWAAYASSDWGFHNPSNGSLSMGIEYSDDGTIWTAVAGGNSGSFSDSTSYSTTPLDVSFDSVGAHRYWRIATVCSGANRMAEVQFYEMGLPSDMILLPVATSLATANPVDATAYFVVEDVVGVVNGIDRTVKLSIDGGITWATATIAEVGAYGATDKLIQASADVSVQSGSSLVWKLETFNTKLQKIKYAAVVPGY